MTKVEAVEVLEKNYPNLMVYSIVEEPDKFIASMVSKKRERVVGGTKGVIKQTGKTIEINPLMYDGLIEKLTSKSAKI